MTTEQPQKQYEIRMVSLGFMWHILVINIVEVGCAIADYDKYLIKDKTGRKESTERNISGAANIINCIRLLCKPKAVMILVPVNSPVDSVIKNLIEHFQLDDFSLSKVQFCLKQYNTSSNVSKKIYLEDSKKT